MSTTKLLLRLLLPCADFHQTDRYGKPVANLMMKVHALVAKFPGQARPRWSLVMTWQANAGVIDVVAARCHCRVVESFVLLLPLLLAMIHFRLFG